MEKLKLEIKNKSNDEIKESILSLNNKQLEYINQSSYLNIFNSTLIVRERMDKSSELNNIRNSSEFKMINNYLNYVVDLIKEITDFGLENIKPNRVEELYAKRESLHNLSSIIEGYYMELNYVAMLINHYIQKISAERDYKDREYSKSEVLKMVDAINRELNNVREDYYKYSFIISQVISVVPMRLVKDNYFNVVKNSIIRNFKSSTKYEVEKRIKEYKKIFDSSMLDGYGTKFDYYFREIQYLRNMDLSNKEFSDLTNLLDKIKDLSEELLSLYNLIIEIGLSVNMIIVISLIGKNLDSNEIEEIYIEWKGLLDNSDKSSIDDFLVKSKEKIKSIEKEMASDLENFYLLNTEAIGREEFNYDEINIELGKTKEILTYYNDTELNSKEILLLDNENMVTINYLEQVSDSLIKYINRSFTGMNNLERKIRMRNLLSAIELPFSGIGEFLDYIEYSLDLKVSSKETINYIIDYIYYFLKEIRKTGK